MLFSGKSLFDYKFVTDNYSTIFPDKMQTQFATILHKKMDSFIDNIHNIW